MTLKLYIGNKVYSSWSLRGWLAVKQSGLPFAEEVVSLYDEAWVTRREAPEFAASNGKVPVLWDGDAAIWESLAIIDYLADKTSRDRFWPAEDKARALARSIASEMHAGYSALRQQHGMNLRKVYPPEPLTPEVSADIQRITSLWDQAKRGFGQGGDYLFGAFGAVDIMFAPVVTRFRTYSIALPSLASDYCEAVWNHPFMIEWSEGAAGESWVIDKFERAAEQA
ncbi:glutathione S-transferase [Sphingomonas sp. Root710]|uniref:glutathione S-transferase family protein n=1 Tax=Sphingomonas sp. Root710 TaxID=1736594 RepID=UPI0006FD3061|nr:glutathione S-transferase family protein [Sphingomonas sp. Root710]KRB81325.1 glutathione S-transferase [Sphingomonas sp. Root710]